MMNKILLSIIIPAYNAELTIHSTISSILTSLNNEISYEVIVVENGSIDRTSEIVNKINNPNIKLLHCKKGVSNARNTGIINATGEWIMFVDADDLLVIEYCERLRKIMQESNSDLCFFSRIVDNKIINISNEYQIINSENKEELMIRTLNKPTLFGLVYSKIYKRETLTLSKIKFDTNMKYGEDSDFVLRFLEKCNQVELFPWPIYEVVANINSLTHSINNEKIYDYADSMIATKNHLNLHDKELKNAYYNYVLTNFNIVMVNNTFSYFNESTNSQKLEDLKEAMKIEPFKSAIAKMKFLHSDKINAIIVFLLRLHMYALVSKIYKIRANQKYKELIN